MPLPTLPSRSAVRASVLRLITLAVGLGVTPRLLAEEVEDKAARRLAPLFRDARTAEEESAAAAALTDLVQDLTTRGLDAQLTYLLSGRRALADAEEELSELFVFLHLEHQTAPASEFVSA